MSTDEKKCSRCRRWKATDEYNRQKSGRDGLRSVCKSCQRDEQKRRDAGKKTTRENRTAPRDNTALVTLSCGCKRRFSPWPDKNDELLCYSCLIPVRIESMSAIRVESWR